MKSSVKETALLIILSLILVDATYVAFGRANNVRRPPARVTRLGGVVRLMTPEGRTYCSGSVVNDSTVITAAHCVAQESMMGIEINKEPIEVRAEDGIARNTFGKVHYVSPQLDHAVLKGNFQTYNRFPIVDDIEELQRLRKTTNLISCGYPMGGDLFCTHLNYTGPNFFMWSVNGVLIPGMSGGPVLTPDGRQIAINDAVTENTSVVSPIYNIHTGF